RDATKAQVSFRSLQAMNNLVSCAAVQHPLANDAATRSRQDGPNLCSEQPDSATAKRSRDWLLPRARLINASTSAVVSTVAAAVAATNPGFFAFSASSRTADQPLVRSRSVSACLRAVSIASVPDGPPPSDRCGKWSSNSHFVFVT